MRLQRLRTLVLLLSCAVAATMGPAHAVRSTRELLSEVDAEPVEAHSHEQERWFPVPVPDLDADGIDDLLDVRYGNSGVLEHLRLVLRSGATGAARWTYTSAHHTGFAVVAHVGPQGELGIGLIEEHYGRDDPMEGMWAVALTADGHKLFDEPIPQPFPRLPRVSGLLAGRPGRAAEFLLEFEHPNPVIGWDHDVYVVSLANGLLEPRGASIHSLSEFNATTPVGDIDGDGLPDIAVVYKSPLDRLNEFWRVRLRLRNGVDHADVPLIEADLFDLAIGIPDVTGDGRDDVVVGGELSRYPMNSFDPPADRVEPVQAESSDLGPARITLVDAAAGRAVWSGEGGHATWQGDINGDGIGDVVVWTVRHEASGRLTGTALTGTGERIYERELAVIEHVGGGRVAAWVHQVGDVDGDGVEDLLYELFDDSGSTVKRMPGLHDGRTGNLLRRELVQPLHASLDGAGADVQHVDLETGKITVSDGRTGRPLAEVQLTPPTHEMSRGLVPGHAESDGCLGLLLPRRVAEHAVDTYAFSVGDEGVAWGVRRLDGRESRDVAGVTVKRLAALCGHAAPQPTSGVPSRDVPPDLPATGLPVGLLATATGAGVAAMVATRRTRFRRA